MLTTGMSFSLNELLAFVCLNTHICVCGYMNVCMYMSNPVFMYVLCVYVCMYMYKCV